MTTTPSPCQTPCQKGLNGMDMEELKNTIIEKGMELGLDQISFIPVQPMPLWEEGIKVRKTDDVETAKYWDVIGISPLCHSVMPEGKTIIAAAYPYAPYSRDLSSDKGYYSAHYRSYPKGRSAIKELSKTLVNEGYKVEVDPKLPMKEIAYRSGIGQFGKNGLIHNERHGSFMTLHIILTDAILSYTNVTLNEISDCGSCTLCIDSCPMNAIHENGVIHISRCLRYYMISSDYIPIEVREKIENRILGCEDCQICCPKNTKQYKKTAMPMDEIFDLKELLSAYPTGLKGHMETIGNVIGKNYARTQKILSMAIIAAGNSKDPSYLPLLEKTLNHPHPPIRAHSAWAISKLSDQNDMKQL